MAMGRFYMTKYRITTDIWMVNWAHAGDSARSVRTVRVTWQAPARPITLLFVGWQVSFSQFRLDLN